MKISRILTVLSIIILTVFAIWYFIFNKQHGAIDDQQPLTKVSFGMLPYGDHTQAIIAVKKDWFKDVGIDLKYEPIKVEGVVSSLSSGRLDIVSTSPGIIISSHDNAQDLCMFVFADVFQGYAIMAQANGNYKSYQEYIQEGQTPNEAIHNTMLQLKGKTFAYPSEAAIKPFIDILFEKAGMSRSDFTSLVQDDALNINAMRNKSADFQVGGAPSRVTLQKEGFKPLVSSIDVVQAAKASPDSKELASVFQDGWATTKNYYEKNKPTIYRLASVNFRITDYIVNHPDSALDLHMPYLSQVTGEIYTSEDGKIIYSSLDPFYTFDSQKDWFHNPNDPLFFQNLYGSLINSLSSEGIFQKGIPKVDDIIYADNVYMELEDLKQKSEDLFKQIEAMPKPLKIEDSDNYSKSKFYYSIFDYFDSYNYAQKVIGSN